MYIILCGLCLLGQFSESPVTATCLFFILRSNAIVRFLILPICTFNKLNGSICIAHSVFNSCSVVVEYKIGRAKSEDLKPLHKLLFRKVCKVRAAKDNSVVKLSTMSLLT